MTDKKAYPVTPHPPPGFVPTPAQPATYGGTLAGATPYGVFPNQPQLYAAQGPPPPTYEQTFGQSVMYQPMYSQGYPAYVASPCYSPYGSLQYYPPLGATCYPTTIPGPIRPHTFMMPNGFDATNRFDGISQSMLPPPPAVPNAAQLAAMASHSVAISQKKNFLGGGTEGSYTFW